MKKKTIALIVSLVLVLGCVVGGTIAWLTDTTDSLVNTFTVGNVDITLEETNVDGNSALANDYKMIPNTAITKDPKVTVVAGSEACWLFVKVDKSANFDTFMTYQMAEGWTALDGETGVYYRLVNAATALTGDEYGVLLNDTVNVKDSVTKLDMDGLTDRTTYPTLTFTAFAVQSEGFTAPADAWAELN